MKAMRKVLTFIMVLALLASLCCTAVLADNEDIAAAAEEVVEAAAADETETADEVISAPAEEIADGDVPMLTEDAEEADTTAESGLPESEHDYANNTDQTWSYTVDGATVGVFVTFDASTRTESNYDYIYLIDGNGNEVGKYTGTTLAGTSIYVPTASVSIRLTADYSGTYYGFKVTSIKAAVPGDLANNGVISHISPIYSGESAAITVTAENKVLTEGTDYTVSYDNQTPGTNTVTVTGIGSYWYGSISSTVDVVDPEDLQDGPEVYVTRISLRQAGDTGSSYVRFGTLTDDQAANIKSITLTPVEQNEDGSYADYTGHPYGAITLNASDLSVSGNYVYFTRTAEAPVVYVEAGHDQAMVSGRWGSTGPYNMQTYRVDITFNDFYKNTSGYTTYYTGTCAEFSIVVVDEDGTRTTVKSWTADEIEAMASFANGSSQCGMTGFRTFSGMGVSLDDLLKQAGVSVSESDYFLMDTSDQYGNYFTYADLFGTTRYFLKGIYDDDFYEQYAALVDSDDAAGSTIELRKLLAQMALEDNSTALPRVNVYYVESLISGSDLQNAALPTAANTSYNSLVAYENQYRFTYGIKLVQEDCTVTFDTGDGSEVASQTVKSNWMTSTENTTMRSSYWVSSFVIYRGRGTDHITQPSEAADTLTVPETPTRYGYTFGGWYTDADCTDGNEFDFTANNGTVDTDTTLYAKWVPDTAAPIVTGLTLSSAEHDDEDAELNQTIIATVQFNQPIALLKDDLSEDIDILISGGNVLNTARTVTYEVNPEDNTQLIITMTSTGWAAVYSGLININEAEGGIQNIVSAADSSVKAQWTDLESYIAIGIELDNEATAGTAEEPASTVVTVTHKANMRGMYHFQLLSNGVPVYDGDTSYYAGSMTSHAHNFYTSITKAAIASAMATAINNNCDGYTATYNDGDEFFTVTADNAVDGEVLTVVMYENNADGRTVDPLLTKYAENGQSYLDELNADDNVYTEESVKALEDAIAALRDMIGTNPNIAEQAEAKAALEAAMDGIEIVLTSATYTKESKADTSITCGLPAEDLVSVTVDGIELDETAYSVDAENHNIVFAGDYLETLALGEHAVVLTYLDGNEDEEGNLTTMTKETTITVVEKAVEPAPETTEPGKQSDGKGTASGTTPSTGDNGTMVIAACLMLMAASAMGVVVIRRRKEQ